MYFSLFATFYVPWGEGEVDESDLGGDFRGVVGVGQFCCDVKLEIIVIWNHSISQLDHESALLTESLKKRK